MSKKGPLCIGKSKTTTAASSVALAPAGRPSSPLDKRVIYYCGDRLAQLKKLPDACIDLIYIDPPFNSHRKYKPLWGETQEKWAFEDRRAPAQAYIDYMRSRLDTWKKDVKIPVATRHVLF